MNNKAASFPTTNCPRRRKGRDSQTPDSPDCGGMNRFSLDEQEGAAQQAQPAENVCLIGQEELHPASAGADGPCRPTSLTFTFRTHVVCWPVRSVLSGRHVALQVCGHEVESWPGLHFCLHNPHTQNGPAASTKPDQIPCLFVGRGSSLPSPKNSTPPPSFY